METKITFADAPAHYVLCLNRKCNRAETCLRQLAEQSIPAEVEHCTFLNPKYLATLEGDCPEYRPSKKVQFAKGFYHLLRNLPHKQMQAVIAQLIAHFGQAKYYRVRKGTRLLSPTEQEEFLYILKKCGIEHPVNFDSYVEHYDW